MMGTDHSAWAPMPFGSPSQQPCKVSYGLLDHSCSLIQDTRVIGQPVAGPETDLSGDDDRDETMSANDLDNLDCPGTYSGLSSCVCLESLMFVGTGWPPTLDTTLYTPPLPQELVHMILSHVIHDSELEVSKGNWNFSVSTLR